MYARIKTSKEKYKNKKEDVMNQIVLQCQNLHKKFGKKEILKGVSLELYQGDILGFIGPNGARKNNYH